MMSWDYHFSSFMQIWVATFIVEYWVRSDQHGSNYVGDSYHKIHDSASDLTNNSEIKDYVALSELSVTLYTFLSANMNRKSQSKQLRLLYFEKVFYRSCLSNHIHRLLISIGGFKKGSGTCSTYVSSVRSSNSHPNLLVIQHEQPLFQITPVLNKNIGLSLSEPQ